MLYLHNRVLFKHKKNDTLSVRTKWMDLDKTLLSEIRQTHANFACGRCLKTQHIREINGDLEEWGSSGRLDNG